MKTMYKNQSAIEQQTKQLNELASKANELMKLVNEQGLIKINSMKDFADLVNEDGEPFIKKRIGEQLPESSFSFGIFKLKRNAAVNLLDLPDFAELNKLAGELKNDLGRLNQLEIKDKSIQASDAAIKKIIEINSFIAITEPEIKAAQAHEQLAELINTMAKVMPITGESKLNDLLLFTHGKEGINTEQRTYYWVEHYNYITNQRGK